MQFNLILATVAAAATAVSGAAVQPRQATFYTVSNFTASCIPHSVMCSYDFDVVAESSMFPTNCSAFVQGPDLLPAIPPTECDNPAYTWSATPEGEGEQDGSGSGSGSGITLRVSTPFNARINITGIYTIPADQLVVEQNGASSSQRYTGPSEFTLPVTGEA
ncbi:hypothetical protein F4779DRAFT_594822 [Xylariaceae sp. FL0662B]|nr:hypothetical protein F4779DRAFT_594822 [Xylariaceae sp. FL0662B]